jgi:hypothetical protein
MAESPALLLLSISSFKEFHFNINRKKNLSLTKFVIISEVETQKTFYMNNLSITKKRWKWEVLMWKIYQDNYLRDTKKWKIKKIKNIGVYDELISRAIGNFAW